MQQSSDTNLRLAQAPIGKLFWSLALPAVISQVVNLLYNMVDRMFIGRIAGDGALALTSVGLCTPIITLITAFSFLVSMGAAPLASIAMGRRDNRQADRILGNAAALLIVLSLIITAALLLFPEQILTLFASNADTMDYAVRYITVYALGTIFVQLTLGLGAFITAQGFAKESMIAVIIGALTNIALDPIFIFGFGWGVSGAAGATILSQALSSVYVLRFLTGKKTVLRLSPAAMRPDWAIIRRSVALGTAPFIMIATESLILLCFNTQLMRFGGTLAVGAMTILSSVMQFAMMPLSGMTQGAQPIVSYNFGAGNAGRVRATFKILFAVCLGYSALLWALAELFPGALAALFTNDAALIDMCRWAMRVYMFGAGLMGAQLACQQTFIALGRAKISTFLALLRKIILLIPLVFILPAVMPDPVRAVFLAEPISDIIAVTVTCALFFKNFNKILRTATPPEQEKIQ